MGHGLTHVLQFLPVVKGCSAEMVVQVGRVSIGGFVLTSFAPNILKIIAWNLALAFVIHALIDALCAVFVRHCSWIDRVPLSSLICIISVALVTEWLRLAIAGCKAP